MLTDNRIFVFFFFLYKIARWPARRTQRLNIIVWVHELLGISLPGKLFLRTKGFFFLLFRITIITTQKRARKKKKKNAWQLFYYNNIILVTAYVKITGMRHGRKTLLYGVLFKRIGGRCSKQYSLLPDVDVIL